MDPDFTRKREMMVHSQIIRRGISNPAVLSAMREVPRHLFLPPNLQDFAYEDGPLPIGEGQTISQPYIVALMTQAAEVTSTSKVLEIGTGSGYQAAILSRIAKEVFSIERIPSLAHHAKSVLKSLNYSNVFVHVGDGSKGLPQHKPYDAILVTAGAPVIPHSFLDQLKVGGRVIIPVGDAVSQSLLRLRKGADHQYIQEIIEYVRFVPLIGDEAW